MSEEAILKSLRESLLRGEATGVAGPLVRLTEDELKVVVGGFVALDGSPSRTTTNGTTTCDGTCTCCCNTDCDGSGT